MSVYLVYKNADFAEGRGPMVLKGVFNDQKQAEEYINSNGTGIFGARPPEGMTLAQWCMSGKDGGWGGYDIEVVDPDIDPTKFKRLRA